MSARARSWGLALRLGQRLTGGTASGLSASGLERAGSAVVLRLAPEHAALVGDTVARRLKLLANALGLEPKIVIG
jgi:exopolyphosphatase/guanosine-5'-triphosphate,3'-diphosphate pyrophosphatase